MIYDKEMISYDEHTHRNLVRSVYGFGYGQTELFHMLTDAGCFRVIKQDELDARNRAIMKAEELGMLDEYVIRDFITKFFNIDFDKVEVERIRKPEIDKSEDSLYPENI